MGPRGLSVLERICANWSPVDLGDELVVHVVDPAEHGSGSVWNTRQPSGFLMNTVCSQVTVFPDDSVRMEGPVRRGPSLYEWSRSIASTASLDDGNDTIRNEARRLGPDSYPTRAFYGHYLVWALKEIVRSAPIGVRIVHHRQRAVEVSEDEAGHTVRLADGQLLGGLDAVVLAQGHLPSRPGTREREFGEFAAARGLRYVAPGNPADADLAPIAPGEPTLLLGLGLNFFDHLAVLTSGRGGRFERHDGVLVYHPSGDEPQLYAGSRRGVPLHARGENQKGAHGRHQPAVLTEDVVRALRSAPVDFRADLWPLIAKEVETVYYATELASRLEPSDVARFSGRYRSCTRGQEEAALLDEYGIAEGSRWDWTRVEHPLDRHGFASLEEFRPWLLAHLREDVARAAEGNVRGPVKAALDVLRDLRNEIRAVVDHGGLHGRSHRDDLERWFSPLNAFLSIGPPARRIEEMAALISAGVLDVLGPGTRAEMDHATFLAVSDLMPQPIPVRAVIDARMPAPDIRTADDELLQRLLATGRCRPHRVPDGEGGVLETGGLDVTPRPARVIAADGAPTPGLYALGVPTESVHWVTAVGIRPCSASATVGDADAIARAVLGPHRVPHGVREDISVLGRAM
ncbi:FAD-binding protein [Lentzea sp. PSKA42]|uniref:FAD-binding protein n=1 Tax=Lentzea indica TaxID=2604800 RepID=A0ABX1FYI4_9PSEU|nr:FAD/NAD(P)-binding protein [Lentzea indica]NKE63562.1 FAD-binding protein [Lentzea indica]